MRSCTFESSPRPPKIYNAALYIRLSREDGDKPESDSVTNQKRILENFVAAQPDIEISDAYVDDGWSGATFDRPAFLRMMSDVYAQKVNCVIVKDSSRFGRNASESGRYIGEIFPKLQVRYIAVNDLIDSGKSQGAAVDFLNNTMRGMINEYYVAANSESIRSTLNMERRRGDFIGSFAKYGYKKDPSDHHKLVIDEPAAENVRMIFKLYLSGMGIRGIVRHLNEKGVPNPSTYKREQGMDFKSRSIGNSALWSDKTVRRTLQDRMYIGDMVQGKSRKINYKTKCVRSCTPDEWIIVENTHEPIIDKDDFDRVQRMMDKGVKGSVNTGSVDLFAGLLKCADCGHALIKKTNHNPDKDYVYYRCSTHCKCKAACSAHTIRFERLCNCVLYCIRRMVDIAVDADKVLSELKQNRDQRSSDDLRALLKSKQQEADRIKHLLADLYPDYKSGVLNKDQYQINKQKFELALESLNKSITKLKAAVDDNVNSGSYRDISCGCNRYCNHGQAESDVKTHSNNQNGSGTKIGKNDPNGICLTDSFRRIPYQSTDGLCCTDGSRRIPHQSTDGLCCTDGSRRIPHQSTDGICCTDSLHGLPRQTTNDFIDHFKRHGNIESLTRPLLTELIDQITVHQNGTLDITFNFCDTFADTLELSDRKESS